MKLKLTLKTVFLDRPRGLSSLEELSIVGCWKLLRKNTHPKKKASLKTLRFYLPMHELIASFRPLCEADTHNTKPKNFRFKSNK